MLPQDHCLQYMVAVALVHGDLQACHYENEHAHNPLIDELRAKMEIIEDTQFSADYHNPEKRSIANSIRLVFNDGSSSDWATVAYPIGHKRRRAEGWPVLLDKFKNNLSTRFSPDKVESICNLMLDDNLEKMKVDDFIGKWIV